MLMSAAAQSALYFSFYRISILACSGSLKTVLKKTSDIVLTTSPAFFDNSCSLGSKMCTYYLP